MIAKSRLPPVLVLGAAARCLLEDSLAELLREVSDGAEVRRYFERDKDKEKLCAEVRSELSAASLFGAHRILIVHDCKELLKDDRVREFMPKPSARTFLWLVFVGAERDALPQAPAGAEVRFQEGPRGEVELRRWMEARGRRHGCSLDPEADAALLKRTGFDLDVIDAELEKLSLYCTEGVIRAEHVEALTGRAAEQTFDRFWSLLKLGRSGEALAVKARAAVEGLRMFRGGCTFGESETSATLLFLLVSRIRKVAAVAASEERLREAATKALQIHGSFAHFLRQDAREIGGRRMESWLNAALAAEIRQRTTGGPPPELNLEFLIMDLA